MIMTIIEIHYLITDCSDSSFTAIIFLITSPKKPRRSGGILFRAIICVVVYD